MLRIELAVYVQGATFSEEVERREASRLLMMAIEHLKAGSLPDAISTPSGTVYCKMRREP